MHTEVLHGLKLIELGGSRVMGAPPARRRPAAESSIHDEEEDNVTVNRARPQSSGMTTWACPLCSCVVRLSGTRKQIRDAVVNHIANGHVEVRREKASQTIGH